MTWKINVVPVDILGYFNVASKLHKGFVYFIRKIQHMSRHTKNFIFLSVGGGNRIIYYNSIVDVGCTDSWTIENTEKVDPDSDMNKSRRLGSVTLGRGAAGYVRSIKSK